MMLRREPFAFQVDLEKGRNTEGQKVRREKKGERENKARERE